MKFGTMSTSIGQKTVQNEFEIALAIFCPTITDTVMNVWVLKNSDPMELFLTKALPTDGRTDGRTDRRTD